jgi:hypothetical protein
MDDLLQVTNSREGKLTVRQAAVLAAVERLGRPTLHDLREEFPGLMPSAIARVLEALRRMGKIDWAGDDTRRYLDGVTYWSTALEPTPVPEELQYLWEDLRGDGSDLVVDAEMDPYRGTITILVRLADLAAFLGGDDCEQIQLLRRRLRLLNAAARFGRLAIWPERRADWNGCPVLVLELTLPTRNAPAGLCDPDSP